MLLGRERARSPFYISLQCEDNPRFDGIVSEHFNALHDHADPVVGVDARGQCPPLSRLQTARTSHHRGAPSGDLQFLDDQLASAGVPECERELQFVAFPDFSEIMGIAFERYGGGSISGNRHEQRYEQNDALH